VLATIFVVLMTLATHLVPVVRVAVPPNVEAAVRACHRCTIVTFDADVRVQVETRVADHTALVIIRERRGRVVARWRAAATAIGQSVREWLDANGGQYATDLANEEDSKERPGR